MSGNRNSYETYAVNRRFETKVESENITYPRVTDRLGNIYNILPVQLEATFLLIILIFEQKQANVEVHKITQMLSL